MDVNFKDPNRNFIKLMGGVPIPSKLKAVKKWESAMSDIAKDNNWIHVYSEGSMWFFCDKIRALKKAVSKLHMITKCLFYR